MLKKIAQWFSCKDELIGVWTNYDDGSGLINIFGWSLHFLEKGKGKSYYWESNSESSYDFEWQKGLPIGRGRDEVHPEHVKKIAKWRDKRGKKIFFLE